MNNLDYTEEVRRTANVISLSNATLGLCAESGEVADVMKKFLYQCQALDRTKLIDELGDVRYYLELALVCLGMDIKELEAKNVEKLRKRYPNGFEVKTK